MTTLHLFKAIYALSDARKILAVMFVRHKKITVCTLSQLSEIPMFRRTFLKSERNTILKIRQNYFDSYLYSHSYKEGTVFTILQLSKIC